MKLFLVSDVYPLLYVFMYSIPRRVSRMMDVAYEKQSFCFSKYTVIVCLKITVDEFL
jgi:hypothetical protein